MDDFTFIQPTAKLRKLILINEIKHKPEASQLELAEKIFVAPSMVNSYINQLVNEGLVTKEGTSRNMRYIITPEGDRCREKEFVLYTAELIKQYETARLEVEQRCRRILEEGVTQVVLYGAGSAAEVVLSALQHMQDITVLAIVDDDERKHGRRLFGHIILQPEAIPLFKPEAVVIATIAFQEEIYEKVKDLQYRGIQLIKL